MVDQLDGGEALLDSWRSIGIDYVFCASGSEWASVWEALARQKRDATPGPVYMDFWHETVAVGMAIGYTLVTRRIQAVLLHAGAGLLQGSMAINGALLACVPMLVFSSEGVTFGERPGVDPGSQWYRNLSVVGGTRSLIAPTVKWSHEAASVETLYESVLRTAEIAQHAPAGPAYLGIPVETLLAPWQPPRHRRSLPPPGRKISPQEEIAAATAMILEADNPIIITETAGRDPRATHALTTFCDLLAIPVIEPLSSVCGNFPRRHPLHLGGGNPQLLAQSDLVILINTRSPWYPPSSKPVQAQTLVLDEAPQRPYMAYQVLHADRYLEGEVAHSLAAITAHAVDLGFDKSAIESRRARHAATHATLAQKITETEMRVRESSLTDGLIDPALLAASLRELTTQDSIFVDETITHSQVLQQHLQLDAPGRYYYVQGGLGQGIAVALGVKLAARDKLVVLTLGDGSFIYNPLVASFAASRDQSLPILVVIFNNRKYLSMKQNLLRSYPGGLAAQLDPMPGVSLDTQPELSAFVAPFGMLGLSVTRPDQLASALQRAIESVAAGTTAVINVMLSR